MNSKWQSNLQFLSDASAAAVDLFLTCAHTTNTNLNLEREPFPTTQLNRLVSDCARQLLVRLELDESHWLCFFFFVDGLGGRIERRASHYGAADRVHKTVAKGSPGSSFERCL